MNEKYNIPAMTPAVVLDYLEKIGREWTGQGVVVELGSWLGATMAALLLGLVDSSVAYDRPVYCFDRWKANEPEAKKALRKGVKLKVGQDLFPLFRKNVQTIYPNVYGFKGSIGRTIEKYPGDPIEVCLFDAPKHNPTFQIAIDTLIPYWIPGVTVVGLLDYYFYRDRKERGGKDWERFLVPVDFVEQNKDCFEKLAEWPGQCQCAFFKYVKKIGGQ